MCKHDETRCSLAASDKGSYHREWPSEPSNHEESIEASRQNILRTAEGGLLNVWTDFRNSDSESPDDCDENYNLIPNNIVRAQTTLKRTASVITAIRWNTL